MQQKCAVYSIPASSADRLGLHVDGICGWSWRAAASAWRWRAAASAWRWRIVTARLRRLRILRRRIATARPRVARGPQQIVRAHIDAVQMMSMMVVVY